MKILLQILFIFYTTNCITNNLHAMLSEHPLNQIQITKEEALTHFKNLLIKAKWNTQDFYLIYQQILPHRSYLEKYGFRIISEIDYAKQSITVYINIIYNLNGQIRTIVANDAEFSFFQSRKNRELNA